MSPSVSASAFCTHSRAVSTVCRGVRLPRGANAYELPDEGARGEPQPGCSCPRSRNRAISGRAFRPNQTEAIVVEDKILNIDTIPGDIT